MNKLLGVLAVASMAYLPVTNADVVGFEVGGYQWKPDYQGTIASDSGSVLGDSIDLNDDLGFSDESHNIIWVSLEHPLPIVPNIKIVSSNLEASAESVLTRSIVFNGETYSVNENVATTADLSNIEYTFYYEILDNWVNLDLGLTLRQYDGEIKLATPVSGSNINEEEKIDFIIPLIYGKARIDLPFSGFFVDGQINIISYDDDSISDMMVALGYESDIGFGAKVGYRTFDLDVEEDDLTADIQFDGMYLSAFYHF